MAEKHEEPDFSDSTRTLLEELAKEREHRKWLVDILKRWAQWIAAVSLGVTITWDALVRLIKHLGER